MVLNFNEENVEPIIFALVKNLIPLANHSKGLCVIKRVIQKSKNDFIISTIIDIITENALSLVHNPFGNYVIQTALEVIDIFYFSINF
jgi:hypothetical protein